MFEINGKYTNATVYTDMVEQEAISQIMGLCNHPAFADAKVRVMPDVHAGAGCTIGTTIELAKDMVIPNIVGVDIGCGVRSSVFKIKSELDFEALENFIVANIPTGCNVRESEHKKMNKDVRELVKQVVRDLNLGNLTYHLNSVGSLGGGNHYIEIGKLDETTYMLSVHTGSRNLGKKTCEYFQDKALDTLSGKAKEKDKIAETIKQLKSEGKEREIEKAIAAIKNEAHSYSGKIPKELAYIEGEDFDAYMENMQKCQKMAAENRRLISEDILSFLGVEVEWTFDTIHNYIEDLSIYSTCSNGENSVKKKFIIRKGAIRANLGEKVAIPLNMKDGVIIGVGKGNSEWNCSAPHGAGRLLSRSKAKETLNLDDYRAEMEAQGIKTWSVCRDTLDEAPGAYKPAEMIIEQVKDTIDILWLVKPVYNHKDHSPQRVFGKVED